MNETKSRCYQLYADGKTVKELSRSTFQAMCTADRFKCNTRILAAVYPTQICFHKGTSYLIVQFEQLRQILEGRL